MKSNRFWVITIGTVLLMSVVAAIALRSGSASEAIITLDGEQIRVIDLSSVEKPYSITIDSEEGWNTIAVEHGRIRIIDADCPDRSCVRNGWLDGGIMPIICLPHKLVISLTSGALPEIDAIA